MKPEFLGSIFTDVATIIVGDPCKLLNDKQCRGKPRRRTLYFLREVTEET